MNGWGLARRSVPKRLKKGATAAAAGLGTKELESHMILLVAKVLGRSLSSPTAQGKALRMVLIAKLANTEIEGSTVEQEKLPAPASDMLLTPALAAASLKPAATAWAAQRLSDQVRSARRPWHCLGGHAVIRGRLGCVAHGA
jgi:hypothetical protein